jgi:AmpD protein
MHKDGYLRVKGGANNHMRVTTQHQLETAVQQISEHCDERPGWARPELIVVHCVSLPEGEFGTGAAERLFTGCLDIDEHPSFSDLDGVHVAPHLLIERDGSVHQFVTFDKRAWHAGVSSWQGRELCNDYSIGIELEGSVHVAYTEAQYDCLVQVLRALFEKYDGLSPAGVVGHAEVAPGRKDDPGPHFAWRDLFVRIHPPYIANR